MTSYASSSDYLDIHLKNNEGKISISHEEYKDILYCAALLDNIHDFKENIDFDELKVVMASNKLINPSNPNLICSVKDEDKYLENVIGLKRNDMNHWTKGSNEDLPTSNLLKEYSFINYDDNTKENPIDKTIKMLFDDIKINSNINVPYRNIELVVDTQKGLFDAIKDCTHYFNWLDCAATRIDPAGKSNPKTKKDNLTTDTSEFKKVYYNSIQEVLEIPNYDNSQYPTNPNIEENNTVLFSSNCDITLYTGENHKAYALINPNQNTKKHAKKKYAVPHTFLEKSDKKPQTIKLLRQLLKKLFETIRESNSFKQLKKKETQAEKYTDMHYLMKRFGDAIQALYCKYLQKEGKIPWLVTYDRPLLGHAILYKTPVIVYCNHSRDKAIPGSGLTIAIHNSILGDEAKNKLEKKLKEQQQRQRSIMEDKEKKLQEIKNKNSKLINGYNEMVKKLDKLNIDDFDINTFDNETYKDFLKFLYINFYKNEKYDFAYSLILLINDVYNKNETIEFKNHITLQNDIDKTIVKINKLVKKIKKYEIKDKINNTDRIKMIFHGIRGKTGKYKTIVPENSRRLARVNIGGNSFLIKTKGKLLKMVEENLTKNPLSDKLKSIISIIDGAVDKLNNSTSQSGGNGEEKISDNVKRKRTDKDEGKEGNITKRPRIDEDTKYNDADLHNEIFNYYNELAIFHKINALIIDNFIEEKVVVENIKENNGKQSDSEISVFLKEINKYDLLNKINNFYTNILTPNTSEQIQQLFNINIEHLFETDTDDEDIDNKEILEKLKEKNIFNDNDELDLNYEPDIVSSNDIGAVKLYDTLYDYNSELITINNTYREFKNELYENNTEETIDVISISELNGLFQTQTQTQNVNINTLYERVSKNATNSINVLLNIYNDYNYSGNDYEGKQPPPTVTKFPKKMDVETEGKISVTATATPLKTFPESKLNSNSNRFQRVLFSGGSRNKHNKTKKQVKKPKKTKRKYRGKNRLSLPNAKKKTKKIKKKRNNKTKIKKKRTNKKSKSKQKKHNKSKSKKPKKKQLFEMTIKELKEHVKSKNK